MKHRKKLIAAVLALAGLGSIAAITFPGFTLESTPADGHYLVGYASVGAGGDRRFNLATLRTYFQSGLQASATAATDAELAAGLAGKLDTTAQAADANPAGTALSAAFAARESATSNNFDPDRLAGDTVDDNLIDPALLGTGSIGATQLAATGITPGSYTNVNVTVDADGRITAISNGSTSGTLEIDSLTEATEADLASTDNVLVSDGGTEKRITLANLRDFLQAIAWTFADLTVTNLTATNFTPGSINLGNADTPITRTGAGAIAVAGVAILRASDVDTASEVVATMAFPIEYPVACSDLTTPITTGATKAYFRPAYAFTLTEVRASLLGASSSGNPAIDVNEGGVSVFSTTLTIDSGETTSTTAATAAVISDTAIANDALITIDVDTAGTGATGLIVTLIGYR